MCRSTCTSTSSFHQWYANPSKAPFTAITLAIQNCPRRGVYLPFLLVSLTTTQADANWVPAIHACSPVDTQSSRANVTATFISDLILLIAIIVRLYRWKEARASRSGVWEVLWHQVHLLHLHMHAQLNARCDTIGTYLACPRRPRGGSYSRALMAESQSYVDVFIERYLTEQAASGDERGAP